MRGPSDAPSLPPTHPPPPGPRSPHLPSIIRAPTPRWRPCPRRGHANTTRAKLKLRLAAAAAPDSIFFLRFPGKRESVLKLVLRWRPRRLLQSEHCCRCGYCTVRQQFGRSVPATRFRAAETFPFGRRPRRPVPLLPPWRFLQLQRLLVSLTAGSLRSPFAEEPVRAILLQDGAPNERASRHDR